MKRLSMMVILIFASAFASAQCESGLNKLRDSWVKNWNSKNINGLMELYAPDATYLSMDGKRINGREEIKAFFKQDMDSTSSDQESVHSDQSGCSGEMGYDSGRFTGTADGQQSHGNYLFIVRKKDDQWMVVQHASILTPEQK